MKIINGKQNFIKIMIDNVEDTALEQIQQIADNPAMKNSNIVIMPDCHAGAGCVIGFTQDISKNDYIIPNLIGVDIGCGVLSLKLGKIDIDLEKLDNFIKDNIPHGFKHRKQPHNITHGLVLKNNIVDDIEIYNQIGTLGSGNHFIEVGIDSKGEKWLFIHSGSRNFGKKVANFYQSKAKEICDNYFVKTNKGAEFLHKSSKYYTQYISDLKVAQKMAKYNRQAIAIDILDFLNIKQNETFDTVHNYIKNNIIRKGAISAYDGENCTIPFNMRDGVAICRGKGNKKWNYSAPHGAGRVLSRKKAKEQLNLESVKKEMVENNIYTSTAHLAIDEAPQAYKDKDIIINAISDTVDVIDFVKPIYNFKSY